MQKSYVAKTTINLVNFEFYIRPGDLLVHDPANQNRLTVYRNGQIVKVVKQDPLGLAVFLKVKFIEEITPVAASPVVEASKATPVVADAPVTQPERPKPYSKRDKMVPREVLIRDNPRLMEALGLPAADDPKEETTEEETTIEK